MNYKINIWSPNWVGWTCLVRPTQAIGSQRPGSIRSCGAEGPAPGGEALYFHTASIFGILLIVHNAPAHTLQGRHWCKKKIALECSRPLLALYGGVPTWDKQICKIGWVFWDGGNIQKLDRVWFECDSILIHMHAQVPPPYPGETWSRYVRYVKIRSTLGKYVSESRLLWPLTACFLLSQLSLFLFLLRLAINTLHHLGSWDGIWWLLRPGHGSNASTKLTALGVVLKLKVA